MNALEPALIVALRAFIIAGTIIGLLTLVVVSYHFLRIVFNVLEAFSNHVIGRFINKLWRNNHD